MSSTSSIFDGYPLFGALGGPMLGNLPARVVTPQSQVPWRVIKYLTVVILALLGATYYFGYRQANWTSVELEKWHRATLAEEIKRGVEVSNKAYTDLTTQQKFYENKLIIQRELRENEEEEYRRIILEKTNKINQMNVKAFMGEAFSSEYKIYLPDLVAAYMSTLIQFMRVRINCYLFETNVINTLGMMLIVVFIKYILSKFLRNLKTYRRTRKIMMEKCLKDPGLESMLKDSKIRVYENSPKCQIQLRSEDTGSHVGYGVRIDIEEKPYLIMPLHVAVEKVMDACGNTYNTARKHYQPHLDVLAFPICLSEVPECAVVKPISMPKISFPAACVVDEADINFVYGSNGEVSRDDDTVVLYTGSTLPGFSGALYVNSTGKHMNKAYAMHLGGGTLANNGIYLQKVKDNLRRLVNGAALDTIPLPKELTEQQREVLVDALNTVKEKDVKVKSPLEKCEKASVKFSLGPTVRSGKTPILITSDKYSGLPRNKASLNKKRKVGVENRAEYWRLKKLAEAYADDRADSEYDMEEDVWYDDNSSYAESEPEYSDIDDDEHRAQREYDEEANDAMLEMIFGESAGTFDITGRHNIVAKLVKENRITFDVNAPLSEEAFEKGVTTIFRQQAGMERLESKFNKLFVRLEKNNPNIEQLELGETFLQSLMNKAIRKEDVTMSVLALAFKAIYDKLETDSKDKSRVRKRVLGQSLKVAIAQVKEGVKETMATCVDRRLAGDDSSECIITLGAINLIFNFIKNIYRIELVNRGNAKVNLKTPHDYEHIINRCSMSEEQARIFREAMGGTKKVSTNVNNFHSAFIGMEEQGSSTSCEKSNLNMQMGQPVGPQQETGTSQDLLKALSLSQSQIKEHKEKNAQLSQQMSEMTKNCAFMEDVSKILIAAQISSKQGESKPIVQQQSIPSQNLESTLKTVVPSTKKKNANQKLKERELKLEKREKEFALKENPDSNNKVLQAALVRIQKLESIRNQTEAI